MPAESAIGDDSREELKCSELFDLLRFLAACFSVDKCWTNVTFGGCFRQFRNRSEMTRLQKAC
jgi:hypothetical protein